MGGVSVEVLRDNGSSGCIVRDSLVRNHQFTGRRIKVCMINGSTTTVPEARVEIESPFLSGSILAAAMRDPIYALIVGNVQGAKSGSTSEIATQTGAAAVTRGVAKARGNPKPQMVTTPAELAESQDVVQEQQQDASLASVRAKLGKAVVEDDQGRKLWIAEKGGRIYRVVQYPNSEEQWQFVVPLNYRTAILRMGHEGSLGGHMGRQKTQDRVQAEFYWPGIASDIRRWIRSCDVCQKTCDRGRVKPAPLHPLPVITTPFEKVGVDIVGPIHPRASDGSRYILTLVDFGTRWPEAVALKNIETTTVAEAMLEIFCRVGIPKEILSDRGTQFTSAMMEEILRLLSVKGLKTTPYHPQCNGLVERFNGTLKKMLRRMTADQPKEWPRFISPLLFAYREAPQSSLKFSPFELVYGRAVRGPLQVLRELWDNDEPNEEVKTTYTYVLDLAERLKSTCELAKIELTKAKEVQKFHFDKKAKVRRLEQGSKCLVLLPTATNKLVAQWRGPYTVIERASEVNYIVQVGNLKKRFHINMLKEYHTRQVSGAAIMEGSCRWQVATPEMAETVDLVRGHYASGECQVTAAAAVILEAEGDGPETVQLGQEEGLSQVRRGAELSSQEGRQLDSLLSKYRGVFSDRPGVARVESHAIELTSSVPVRVKPYPIPIRMQDQVRQEIKEMELAGIIEKSSSPYCSPMVVVRKKEGGVRICGDYRRLNALTRVDAEPMCDLRAIFARLAGSRIFSKLDLTKGFFQIPLDPASRKVTAFGTPDGLYQYTVLPFGLTNSPAVFNRMMRQVLQDIPGVEVFVDDVLVHSQSFKEHMSTLEKVLSRLQGYNLTVKPSKCEVGQKWVQYLGHVVGDGNCGCQGDKISKIRDAPRPTTKKQVRSFLGLAGYYRDYIPKFAALASPLYDLLMKHAPNRVPWGTEQEEAFTALKDKLCKEPILQLPDFKKSFVLRTDASQDAVGAVLMQEKEGEVFPVAYHSRRLKGAELRYSTVELELLAIVEGVKKYYFYLFGGEFTLETDHMPLCNLKTSKNANARLMRWTLFLQQFSFVVRYIKGSANVGADWLSRLSEFREE